MKYDAFISYRHDTESQKYAKQLYEFLKNEGFKVWFDVETILPGQGWANEIREALENSSIILFLFSGESINKGWLQKEIEIAMRQDKRIVPVVTDKKYLADLPRGLAERQAIVLSNEPEEVQRQFKWLLKEIDGSVDFWSKLRSYIINDS